LIVPRKLSLDLGAVLTLFRFVEDSSFVRIAIGPVGSGKSTVMCGEIMRLAQLQEPSPHDGVRRFKCGIVRNTYGELISTTLKTWRAMFPEELCGPIRYSAPITHRIFVPAKGRPGDENHKPGLDLEIEFLALDRPKDVKKLLSWEGSIIWFNECREIERAIFDAATARVGRYPSFAQGGVACSFAGIIADTNPPDEDHWLYELEAERPDGWAFFHQPAAVVELGEVKFNYEPEDVIHAAGSTYIVNPGAENLKFLPPNYYQRMLPGKRRDWIDVYACAKYGYVQDGKPVIPEYNAELMRRAELPILDDRDLWIGADIGGGTLSPAAIIAQRHARGTWLIHAEVVCTEMGTDRFTDMIHQTMAETFGDRKIKRGWGDPAGATRDEIFETAIFQHMRSKSIPMFAAPTNDPNARIQAIAAPMGRMIDGQPGILIHERCAELHKGLGGRWRYRRLQVAGSERYSDVPEKNQWSHPCDGLGYLLSGGGEDRALRGRSQSTAGQGQATIDFDVFN
jgi:hypothetical protein